MKRHAVIENGKVVNMILWDGATEVALPKGLVEVDDKVLIGDDYDGKSFSRQEVEYVATLADNLEIKARMMTKATEMISILADANDPFLVKTSNIKAMEDQLAWKKFRVAVYNLDLTANPVDWPTVPE